MKTCTQCGQPRDRKSSWCSQCLSAYKKNWHRMKMLSPEYKAKHAAASKEHYYNNRDSYLSESKRKNDELRAEIISAYGCQCACCGQREPTFLALDHVNNDGAEHRRLVGPSQAVYRDVKRRGFPKDEFQLLCHNCNWSKNLLGVCVHKLRRVAA